MLSVPHRRNKLKFFCLETKEPKVQGFRIFVHYTAINLSAQSKPWERKWFYKVFATLLRIADGCRFTKEVQKIYRVPIQTF